MEVQAMNRAWTLHHQHCQIHLEIRVVLTVFIPARILLLFWFGCLWMVTTTILRIVPWRGLPFLRTDFEFWLEAFECQIDSFHALMIGKVPPQFGTFLVSKSGFSLLLLTQNLLLSWSTKRVKRTFFPRRFSLNFGVTTRITFLQTRLLLCDWVFYWDKA